MNKGNVILALVVTIGAAVITWQVIGLVLLYMADVHPPYVPEPDGPAAAEVSALIEEARKITKEASE